MFKNTLAASGYIIAIAGGGFGIHHLNQDKTIGDLLQRLGKVHTKEEDFKKAYKLLKTSPEFNSDIKANIALNFTNIDDNEGAKLLKSWCDLSSALPITKENTEKVLPKAQKYCLDFEEVAINTLTTKTGLNWKDVKKRIVNKGISPNGQLFLSFTDNSGERGRWKTYSYCWDTSKNDWIDSTNSEDCRKYVNP